MRAASRRAYSAGMVSIEQVLGFSAIAVVIIVIPGPSVLFVVGRALAHGRRTALTSVVGNELGALVAVVAVGLGVGSVIERSALLFTVLKLAGAAYLCYLGVQAFRHRRSLEGALDELGAASRAAGRRELWQGFVVGVTNPKTLVFFAAVLPQFADPARGHVPLQMMTFGLIFCLIALLCDSMWGLAAATARQWFARSPRRLSVVGGTGGLMMIGLAVTVAATGRKD
ncbi:putative translocator [Actinomadura sp. NBRC 104412]|nr:putative translocator [Actinomadura sp. NBRC 104412]